MSEQNKADLLKAVAPPKKSRAEPHAEIVTVDLASGIEVKVVPAGVEAREEPYAMSKNIYRNF